MDKLQQTETNERITPLIGVFILSWIFMNRSGITNFTLGDDETKKTIVANYSIDSSEILIPLAITCGYILLAQLILPFIRYKLDEAKLKYIDRKRFEHRSELSMANSKQEAIKNKEKYKARVDDIQRLADKELSDWKEENAELTDKVTTHALEIEKLNAQVKKFTRELDSRDEQLQNVTEECNELIAQEKNLIQELSQSQQLYKAMKEVARRLTLLRDEKENKIKKLSASNKLLSTEFNKAAAELNKATAELNEATAELDEASAELDEATAELDEATAELDDVKREVDKIQEELDEAEKEFDEIQEELNEVKDDLDNVQEELDEVQKELDEVKEDLDNVQEELDEVQKELDEA